jgi:thymidylate kinase
MNPIAAEKQKPPLALDRLNLPRFAARDVSRPFIVALEGPNGAGKSTLCHSLSRALNAPCCLGTDQAWFSDSFRVRMIRDAEWYASAMFFLSGCFEQMRLLHGRSEPIILMDRSMWSTLAVHAAKSAKRLEALLAMLRPVAEQIQVPDLTVVLVASFVTCQSRIAHKTGSARALDELTATPAFHAREQEFYRWLSRQTPGLVFLKVDRASAEQVAEKALALVREMAPC